MTKIPLVGILICASAGVCFAAVRPGSEAQYSLSAAAEGHTPPVKRMRLVAMETERLEGKRYQWWEMTMEKTDGNGLLGVRALSRQVPLTSADAPGEIVRYIIRLSDGVCYEYRDERTGRALLPTCILDWADKFLPKPARDARYDEGFSNSGGMLGHVLVRASLRSDFPKITFDNVRVLSLRPELLIGNQAEVHPPPGGQGDQTPWSREDYEQMIAAGMNYFGGREMYWLLEQPVFVHGMGHHPDDYYRSNLLAHRRYLDEPMVRFDWSPWVQRHLASPDVAAEAIRIRVQRMNEPRERRRLRASNYPEGWDEFGNMNPLTPPSPSWETCFWSAWFQMAGGVPGIIHEGRYRPRGYDWEPESLFGEGCEALTDREMFDFFYAFMRGAARAFDGYWGTAIYPESAYEQRLPAVIRAYDMGAKIIWFWVHDPINYEEQMRIIRGLMAHARAHPRPPDEVTVRGAEVGIVFPAGHAFSWWGTWGKDREQVNEYGVSYGEISAAAVWEGILCSRRGIEYDFLVDCPDIERMGYKRLVWIREDGTIDVRPAWGDDRSPRNLRLSLDQQPGPGIAARADRAADFRIPRAGKMKIDADFRDWAGADWIMMSGDPHLFADIIDAELTIQVPEGMTPTDDRQYLGFSYEQINEELKTKYLLEGFWDRKGTVVTSVKPDSPAAKAGLREGDVIFHFGPKRTWWSFELWGTIDRLMKQPGPQSIGVRLKRSGHDRYHGPGDLSARVAFLVDDDNLCFAAQVTDDVHTQMRSGWQSWMHDSVQIGIDPTLERGDGYGENGHEIAFVLKEGEPYVWRYAGRRGQPAGLLGNARVAIKRVGDQTLYEAAVPLAELTPLSPDMWPHAGLCVVINDSDDADGRKARLELRLGAMTRGKRLNQFADFEFAPSQDQSKVSASIFWDRRALRPGGRATLTVAVRSPQTTRARIHARLRSLDEPKAKPAEAEIEIPITDEPTEWRLNASTGSQPGRYRLDVVVRDPKGRVVARDSQPIYVYR